MASYSFSKVWQRIAYSIKSNSLTNLEPTLKYSITYSKPNDANIFAYESAYFPTKEYIDVDV